MKHIRPSVKSPCQSTHRTRNPKYSTDMQREKHMQGALKIGSSSYGGRFCRLLREVSVWSGLRSGLLALKATAVKEGAPPATDCNSLQGSQLCHVVCTGASLSTPSARRSKKIYGAWRRAPGDLLPGPSGVQRSPSVFEVGIFIPRRLSEHARAQSSCRVTRLRLNFVAKGLISTQDPRSNFLTGRSSAVNFGPLNLAGGSGRRGLRCNEALCWKAEPLTGMMPDWKIADGCR